jgi:uncharacterized membrane protein
LTSAVGRGWWVASSTCPNTTNKELNSRVSEERMKKIERKKRTKKERNRDWMREEWKGERMG